MKTVKEIIEILKPSEILVEAGNYLQYIDSKNNFCEAQKDYVKGGWYKFKTTGKASNPVEKFLNWIG